MIGVDGGGAGRDGHQPLLWAELGAHTESSVLRQRVEQRTCEAVDIGLPDRHIGVGILSPGKACRVLDGNASHTAQSIDIQCCNVATGAYS